LEAGYGGIPSFRRNPGEIVLHRKNETTGLTIEHHKLLYDKLGSGFWPGGGKILVGEIVLHRKNDTTTELTIVHHKLLYDKLVGFGRVAGKS
jgi:hypothetical protein